MRPDLQQVFDHIHRSEWEKEIMVHPYFIMYKSTVPLLDYTDIRRIDLVYFDAFSPTTQPELWTATAFARLVPTMTEGATLLTYCSKSIVRTAMRTAGLSVEKIPGPWGKREMVRATKS
jgi:tRNA U34 5-methylaminomethyl-2-thiouridine-forming methyltransferase MnmC